MSKVLVTGGAGFIGSHVVDALLQKGDDIVVVDNLCAGKEENINSQARFYQLDICNPELKEVFVKEKIDWVSHHAAQIDVRKSVESPQFDAQVNITGLLNLLENCRQYNIKGLVFASSGGAIHGEPTRLPVSETDSKGPFSPYGISKLASEYYLFYYHRVHGLPYVTLRYSNVYGPRQDTGGEAGVIAIFTGKMLAGKSASIFGDGEAKRDYVYVEDIAAANLKAFEKIRAMPVARSIDDRAFNIATGIETSVNSLFNKLKEITGSAFGANYEAERKGEIKQICLDIHKAEKRLCWKPATDLDEGLKKTVNYWKKVKQSK